MWLINTALRRPIMVIVLVVGIALCSILAYQRMSIDIFPNLDLPVIYVAQPYGGMNPAQMESFLVSYYEYHFLYITGIEHVESKSIQGVGLCKLYFHPGTDMSTALAQVVSYVERAQLSCRPARVTLCRALRRGQCPGGPIGVFQRHEEQCRDPGSRRYSRLGRCFPLCRVSRRRRRSAATRER